jgi:foldase protein PrsA
MKGSKEHQGHDHPHKEKEEVVKQTEPEVLPVVEDTSDLAKEEVEVNEYSPASLREEDESRASSGTSATVRINKKVLVAVVLAVLIVAGAYYTKSTFIAATVNGSPIARSAVVKEIEAKYGEKALEFLVTKKIILDEAKKRGVSVSEDEISAEILSIEEEVSKQGMALDQLLNMQGMTRSDLTDQLRLQKTVEKMAGEDVTVTAEEIDSFIKENKVTLEKGKEVETRAEIEKQIAAQKKSEKGQALVTELRTAAKVTSFVPYYNPTTPTSPAPQQ